MAKVKQKKKTGKKKKWFEILSPACFGSVKIGESYLYEPSLLKNKSMTVNLTTITGKPRQQNLNITFKVTDVLDNKGVTKTTKLQIMPASIKRYIKKGRTKVEDSFTTKCKDGVCRIKPLLIPISRISKSIATEIRKIVREEMAKIAENEAFENLILGILDQKYQKQIKQKLSKTYPIRTFEIKCIKIETPKRKTFVKEAVKEEKEAAESQS